MAPISSTRVQPVRHLQGRLQLPGDKSISHRYALLASLADGRSTLHHYAPGADCQTTLDCLTRLGVPIVRDGETVIVDGRGLGGFGSPGRPLDCGNSGTTARLLAGMLAAQPFATTLAGDASLSRRPMRRIMAPLSEMGARFEATDDHLPLTIHGGPLWGIRFAPDRPSAQVKSAVLLAGLHAEGRTTVVEPAATRDHTERALEAFGVHFDREGLAVSVAGGQRLTPVTMQIPGDISSAAFVLVAAAALAGSDVTCLDVGLNPSRTGFLDVLRRYGAVVDTQIKSGEAGEPLGWVRVRPGDRRDIVIAPTDVPGLIDELPALAALATFGGRVEVRGAAELRVKESDRITALVGGLRALGADAVEYPDGFRVQGGRPIRGGTADAADDHRLAMAFAVAALGAAGPSVIQGSGAVAISYPGFFAALEMLRA